MKKFKALLLLIIVSMVFTAGCASSKYQYSLYLSECTDNINGMGKNYYINNLEKCTYEIKFTAKEYEYGKLIKEHDLSTTTVDLKSNKNKVKVGVVDSNVVGDYYIKTLVNDIYSDGYYLDFLEEAYNTGVALSILDEDKELQFDNDVAIAAYCVGGENNGTSAIGIDNEFQVSDQNKRDLIVYLNIHMVNN